MGEAKRRGTYEQRKAASIMKQVAIKTTEQQSKGIYQKRMPYLTTMLALSTLNNLPKQKV